MKSLMLPDTQPEAPESRITVNMLSEPREASQAMGFCNRQSALNQASGVLLGDTGNFLNLDLDFTLRLKDLGDLKDGIGDGLEFLSLRLKNPSISTALGSSLMHQGSSLR